MPRITKSGNWRLFGDAIPGTYPPWMSAETTNRMATFLSLNAAWLLEKQDMAPNPTPPLRAGGAVEISGRGAYPQPIPGTFSDCVNF
ncbi:MAG: hypothetical protein JXR76_14760 [Deltaproteobacteria bacterium]|nr:hypothetical protein [Deltaproteobacteria bacterium]